MKTINEIVHKFSPEYIERYPHIPPSHRKVINAIVNCRSGRLGTTVYRCIECGERHYVSRSCGNRHCPLCQHHKTQAWLEKQLNRQVPGHHFMITFTVPEEIRPIIRANQSLAYSALFKASSQALKILAKDKRFIGTDLPGFFSVLHTWGRRLQYHPHVHVVVAGGGLSKNKDRWLPSRKDLFVHTRPLSVLFRAIFMKEMEKAGLKSKIPSSVWKKRWIIDSQAVGKAEATIKYLSPYVFRVAISNSRIIKVEARYVYFKYKKTGSRQWKTTRLEVMDFIRHFLQHVLPSGFMKVRHYGFLNPSCGLSIGKVRELIEKRTGEWVPLIELKPPVRCYCQDCGGELEKIGIILPKPVRRE